MLVLSIFMQQRYSFASNFSFSGQGHVGLLFTNEKKKLMTSKTPVSCMPALFVTSQAETTSQKMAVPMAMLSRFLNVDLDQTTP